MGGGRFSDLTLTTAHGGRPKNHRSDGAATLAKMAVSGRAGAPPRGVVLYQQSRARRPL
jgi:hypothetical protein